MWKALLAPRADRPDQRPRTPALPALAIAHLPGLVALGVGLVAALVGEPLGGPWLWAPALAIGLVLTWLSLGLVGRTLGALGRDRDGLARRLTETELHRKEFVAELLVNLARRSQGTVYRQLEILGRLQAEEQDRDTLAELFRLDHLAARVQRTATNLLVLAGEQAPRPGAAPAPLREVVRSAITETEDVDRVLFIVDEQQRVTGHAVGDLAHLLSELVENAVRFSPPDSVVSVRSARTEQPGRGRLLTIEDWGVGFPADAVAEVNALMAEPHEVDLSVSQRLGLHVVARLAQRHGIRVVIGPGTSTGTVCTLTLPAALFEPGGADAEPGPGADGETAALPLTPPAGEPVTQRIPALPRPTTAPTAAPAAGGGDADRPAPAGPVPRVVPLLRSAGIGGPDLTADGPSAPAAARTPTGEPAPASGSAPRTPHREPASASGAARTADPATHRPADDAAPTTAIRVPTARAGDDPTPRPSHAAVDLFDPAPIPRQTGAPDAGPAPDDPTPTPAGGTPLATALPHRPGGRGAGGRALPGPFGSTGSWEGWWDSPEDPPSPVSATAPASTGPWPVVGAPADAARPRPPVAAPPGPVRQPAAGAPIAWVDPSPTPATASGFLAFPAPPADPAPTPTPPAGSPTVALPGPMPPTAVPREPADDRPAGGLRRRVPQANLAPELRDPAPEPAAAGDPTAIPAVDAAAALSRYQASREAARSAVADDADRPATAPSGGREDARSSARRYESAPAGESVPRTDHSRPRTVGEPAVPMDEGDDRSTRHDAVPPDPGAPAPPDTARSGPRPAAAVSGPTGTGENRAMDRDAGEPSEDHPTREQPHDLAAGGER